MRRFIINRLPRHLKQDIKRAIAYYHSNGLVATVQKLFLKTGNKPIFRFRKNSSDQIYRHIRSAFDFRHEEYSNFRGYSSCDQVIKYIAFYLPQFHPIPENDMWWGDGFTEWSNVTRALPQYIGHYQPRRPGVLGYYDLRLREVRLRQIELAKNYGIYGFCYHYYWFSGKKLLDYPINALINDKSQDFPFCINWANENWTRRWDGKEADILLEQSYSEEDYLDFIKDVAVFLQDERYIRVDGKPLLLVYRPSLIPDVKKMVDVWRAYCRNIGIGDIYLVLTHAFDSTDPETIGFDAATDFAPNNMPLKGFSNKVNYINQDFSGTIYDYKSALEITKKYSPPTYTKFRSVCPSWDNEARKTGKGTVLEGATPSLYKEWLDIINQQTIENFDADKRFVFINAWNEWAEGAYLEPDRRFGYAYLEATRSALLDASRNIIGRRIVLVSHDAHPHGAQYLLLHIVKHLYEILKFSIDVVFLNDGELINDFARFSNTHCINRLSDKEVRSLFKKLYNKGAQSAILNTVVSGSVSDIAKDTGFRVVSLVHEMPNLIETYGYVGSARLIAEKSDVIVFPSVIARNGFENTTGVKLDNSIIQPQGLFRKNRIASNTSFTESHSNLCKKLEIPEHSYVVLNVGYGDERKGIDLFVDIAAVIHHQIDSVYFVWVGHMDLLCESKAKDKIKKIDLFDHVIFTGKDFDTDLYYAGADVFALTSREDPFPSVVLEAFDAGCPVVGFDGAGGFVDIVTDDTGVLVEKFDTNAYANEIINILSDDTRMARYRLNTRKLINEEFNFNDYVYKLLDYAGCGLKKISVVIPSYNYEKHIKERIESVLNQSYPIYELIILDDDSKDNSVEIIKSELEKTHVTSHLFVNESNSGSVFEQWYKGASIAKGDYLWIAEADDYSAPDFVTEIMQPFEDDKDVVMSYCESYSINSKGNVIDKDYIDYVSDVSKTKWLSSYINDGVDEIMTTLCIKNTIPNVSSVIFKKNELLSVLDENIDQIKQYKVAGDWVTYLHLLSKGKIAFSPKSYNYHRRHESSITLKKFDDKLLAEILSVQKYIKEKYLPAESVVEKSERYAQELYKQFGLDSTKFPYVHDNAKLKKLVK